MIIRYLGFGRYQDLCIGLDDCVRKQCAVLAQCCLSSCNNAALSNQKGISPFFKLMSFSIEKSIGFYIKIPTNRALICPSSFHCSVLMSLSLSSFSLCLLALRKGDGVAVGVFIGALDLSNRGKELLCTLCVGTRT